MSAKIYYLRPVQRENVDGPAAPPPAEEDEVPPTAPKRSAGKRAAPGALPGGRNSKWKRKLGGGVVRRDAKADDKDDPSKD